MDCNQARGRIAIRLEGHRDDFGLPYVACVYAPLNENERAIEVLERAVDRGYGQREWIETDPDLAPLRGTPRYEAILKAM